MDEQLLRVIQAAKDAVADAEGDLTRLLREVQSGLRADKITISEALQKAFDKLRAAREHLIRLEKLAVAPLH
jgi:hypothetical protein